MRCCMCSWFLPVPHATSRTVVPVAERQVGRVIPDLLTEAAEVGDVRSDVDPEELARYCLHALRAASSTPSKAAVERLVGVTLSGLHTPS